MSDLDNRACCVCHEPCENNPASPGKRWSWGPGGMNCHFECEAEFIVRFPGLAPTDHRPRGPQKRQAR